MPSHKTHIAIGMEVNENLGYDKDLFYLGCILPDLGREHFVSHFKKSHRDYDIEKFINKYYDDNNPVIIGYLIQILTDIYYNKWARNNKYLFDRNHKLNGIKTVNGNFSGSSRDALKKKQKGFYEYDKYLIKNNMIPKLNYVDLNELINIEECGYDERYINNYIDEHNRVIGEKCFDSYEIFSFEELDQLYYSCIQYIKNYLYENKKCKKITMKM